MWAPYFGLVVIFGVGYARLRAESGYPRLWGRPLGGEQNMLVNCIGTERLAALGGMRSLTLMASMHYMTRGYVAQLMCYPTEALKIGDDVGISRRKIIWLMVAAVVFGIVISWVMHLDAFYEYGANILEGGTTSGGYRVTLMRQAYEGAGKWAESPAPPSRPEALASLAGLVMVFGLAGLRRAFLRFPLHRWADPRPDRRRLHRWAMLCCLAHQDGGAEDQRPWGLRALVPASSHRRRAYFGAGPSGGLIASLGARSSAPLPALVLARAHSRTNVFLSLS